MSEAESSVRSGKFSVKGKQTAAAAAIEETSGTDSLTGEEPFSDEEIRIQLEALGYPNVPDYQLRLFKSDLERLIWCQQNLKDDESADEKDEISDDEFAKLPRRAGRSKDVDKDSKAAGKPPRPGTTPQRLQLCKDMGLAFARRSPSPVSSETSKESGGHFRWHRRKVLRHINGVPTVCEESLTDADADNISLSSEHMSTATLGETKKKTRGRSRSYTWAPDCPIVNTILCKEGPPPRRPATASVIGKKKKMTKEDYYDEIVRYLPKAFVDNPDGIQPLKKSNPSDRFNMYRKMWDHYRIPGESPDLELRWCIRALLLTKRVPDVQTYALKKKEAIENARRMKEHKSWL